MRNPKRPVVESASILDEIDVLQLPDGSYVNLDGSPIVVECEECAPGQFVVTFDGVDICVDVVELRRDVARLLATDAEFSALAPQIQAMHDRNR